VGSISQDLIKEAMIELTLNFISSSALRKRHSGLILNLCFVGIPVLLPLWGLSQVGLSWAWVFLCFPVGLWVGQWVYSFLDAMSG
jgi:hypothetical protein